MEPGDPKSLPLDYGGRTDKLLLIHRRRFRAWGLTGVIWAAAMLGAYGYVLHLARRSIDADEAPFAIAIATIGLIATLFLLAGSAGAFVPARWARLSILMGCYAVLGGSIVQMLASLALGSVSFACWGILAVLVQLVMAAVFLYVFHDDDAVEFFDG